MAAEALRSDHGSPSILINNAGIGNTYTILDITPDSLQTLFGVNLLSHWYTIQEFMPDMISKRKGHVMSTSSMSAWLGFAGAAEYAATKTGLTALHESLTQELKYRYKCPQIKTSIVYPIWTRTRLIASIEKGIQRTKQPIMEPEDVAKAMVKQIIACKSGQILLGPRLATAIRAFPIWIQEIIRDGMNQLVVGNTTTAVPPAPPANGAEDTL
jgi:all-trans-retinol dehydrogenase (NAD+)